MDKEHFIHYSSKSKCSRKTGRTVRIIVIVLYRSPVLSTKYRYRVNRYHSALQRSTLGAGFAGLAA